MPYGGIDAVFADRCGNLLNLHQDWPASSCRTCGPGPAQPPLAGVRAGGPV